MPFCPNCGAAVEGRYCAKCGTLVEASTPGATEPAPASQAPVVSTAAGLEDNVAGALCYLVGFITGIIFLVIEPYKYDKFVRFHAFQSIFLSVAWVVFWIAFDIVTAILAHISFGIFGFVMGLIGLLIALGVFLLWLFLMFKAYNNERYMLPFIGELALKQAGQ